MLTIAGFKPWLQSARERQTGVDYTVVAALQKTLSEKGFQDTSIGLLRVKEGNQLGDLVPCLTVRFRQGKNDTTDRTSEFVFKVAEASGDFAEIRKVSGLLGNRFPAESPLQINGVPILIKVEAADLLHPAEPKPAISQPTRKPGATGFTEGNAGPVGSGGLQTGGAISCGFRRKR